jgi:hypothetical protein
MDWRVQIGDDRNKLRLGDSADQKGYRRRVAIIRERSWWFSAAKYLKQHGFEPVIFEQDDEIGGQ